MFGTYDEGSDRGLTTKLWLGCNPDVIENDPRHGMFFIDDFLNVTATVANGVFNGWNVVELATTTGGRVIEVDDENYGVIAIGAVAAADNDGIALFKTGATITPAAGVNIGFEVRAKINTITTGCQFYAGLTDATEDTMPLLSGVILAALENHIGFHTLDLKAINFGSEKATVAATTTIAHAVIVEDTYFKLGFRVNGVSSVDMYVNGVLVANNIVPSTDLPLVTLRPCLSNLAEGTDASLASFDWVAVGAWT